MKTISGNIRKCVYGGLQLKQRFKLHALLAPSPNFLHVLFECSKLFFNHAFAHILLLSFSHELPFCSGTLQPRLTFLVFCEVGLLKCVLTHRPTHRQGLWLTEAHFIMVARIRMLCTGLKQCFVFCLLLDSCRTSATGGLVG